MILLRIALLHQNNVIWDTIYYVQHHNYQSWRCTKCLHLLDCPLSWILDQVLKHFTGRIFWHCHPVESRMYNMKGRSMAFSYSFHSYTCLAPEVHWNSFWIQDIAAAYNVAASLSHELVPGSYTFRWACMTITTIYCLVWSINVEPNTSKAWLNHIGLIFCHTHT